MVASDSNSNTAGSKSDFCSARFAGAARSAAAVVVLMEIVQVRRDHTLAALKFCADNLELGATRCRTLPSEVMYESQSPHPTGGNYSLLTTG